MSQPYAPPGWIADPHAPGAWVPPPLDAAPWQAVPTYRTHAVVAVVLCPLLGLFALLKSFDVDTQLRVGDHRAATASSRTARTLSVTAYWVAGGITVLATVFSALAVAGVIALGFLGASGEGWFDEDAVRYGDSAELDSLWDDCAAGDALACDDLYWTAPTQTEYEVFAATCGFRTTGGEVCTDAVMHRPSGWD